MMADVPDLLVLEPAPRGHGREWLLHIARHAATLRPSPRLAFAVAPRVAEALSRDLAAFDAARPTILTLTEQETALCTHRSLVVSGMARWWTMRRHLERSGARYGLFLEFDHLSLPLALGLPLGAGCSVSGILFRPSVHYEGDARPPLRERLRELRKNLLYRLMLRHAAVHVVHTLDDAFPGFAQARYPHGEKVLALPDPVYPAAVPRAEHRVLADRAPAGRKLFVLFGVLSERKGVLALLHALMLLEYNSADHVAVIIAGELDAAIGDQVRRAKANLEHCRPRLWCHLEPRHLESGEIAALIDRSDFVLAPYQRFVGSSGVLMWAAGRGRPVIAQDYGLVGRLVRDHGLGHTVDTTDPAALAKVIAAAAGGDLGAPPEPKRLKAFAASRTPAAFAAGILETIPGAAFSGRVEAGVKRSAHGPAGAKRVPQAVTEKSHATPG